MYILNKYIQPGERVLFIAKKNGILILLTVVFFLIFGCPLAFVASVIKEKFIIRMLLSLPFIFLLAFLVFTIIQYKKSDLILTSRRILLSQGSFSFKTLAIPTAEVHGMVLTGSAAEIVLANGSTIPLSSVFCILSIKKLITEFNLANKKSGLKGDIKKNRDVNIKGMGISPEPSSMAEEPKPDADQGVLHDSEVIIFTCRAIKSHLLAIYLPFIFIMTLDFGRTAMYNWGFLFKCVMITIWVFFTIAFVRQLLRSLKDKIILTNKKLIIRGYIDYPGTKNTSLKVIPLDAIRKIFYSSYLHVVLKNGEQVTVFIKAKKKNYQKIVDYFNKIKKN